MSSPFSIHMQKKAQRIKEFKEVRGCAYCPEQDAVVLDLHHRDPLTKHAKLRSPKRLTLRYLTWDGLEAEFLKCDVVCANCHRRLTAGVLDG